MASKRKHAEIDSDDDEPTLGRQVLPVANLPLTFDGEPADGLQYLFTVRRDSRLLPHITRVENPYEVEEPIEAPGEELAPHGSHPALPSEEWRETFLGRFRNFQKNCVQPSTSAEIPHAGSSQKVMPDKKDRDAWWAFLSGRARAEWDPPKKPKVQTRQERSARYLSSRYSGGMRGFSDNQDEFVAYDHEPSYTYAGGESSREAWRMHEEGDGERPADRRAAGSLPTPSGTPAPQEGGSQQAGRASDMACAPREPTPSLMRHIDHRYAVHLLMYFTHWMNLHVEMPQTPTWYITNAHARWIFVLLTRVEDFISADDMNQLRSLARACISLIRETKGKGASDSSQGDTWMNVEACWLVIATVVGIWGQRDLWEDAEAMLAELDKTST